VSAHGGRWTSTEDIARRLVEVSPFIAHPTIDVASAVTARLGSEPDHGHAWGHRSSLRPLIRPAWQGLVAASLVIVVATAALLSFSPPARRAVAGWLGLRGVRIEVVPSPSLLPTTMGRPLALGERVSLAEAGDRLGFQLLLPGSGALGEAGPLGEPDEVYLTTVADTQQAHLVWGTRPGLPRAAHTGLGLLLTEFRASIDEQVLVKKGIAEETTILPVTIDGEQGFWLEGTPHVLQYVDEQGRPLEDRTRLAGNVLLWEHGDVTLRLESALSLEEALGIARSVG
jgi:hypothetical protein